MRASAAQRRGMLATAALMLGRVTSAQPPTPPPRGAPPADTARRPAAADPARAAGPRRRPAGATPRASLRPPVTPRRALISSLLLPGLGQVRLHRSIAGALFAGTELAAYAMIAKSYSDLRTAKALRADSLTTVIPVDTLGRPLRTFPKAGGNFTDELVRARGLHVEDWVSVVLFNHLISGAEAYVSAQLFDLPAQITAVPTPRGGAAVAVSVAW